MKTIWKYPIKVTDAQTVLLPPRAEILCVGLDVTGEPSIWVRTERLPADVERTLYVVGTGHDLPDGDNRYVGSFKSASGLFMWHVWEPC